MRALWLIFFAKNFILQKHYLRCKGSKLCWTSFFSENELNKEKCIKVKTIQVSKRTAVINKKNHVQYRYPRS